VDAYLHDHWMPAQWRKAGGRWRLISMHGMRLYSGTIMTRTQVDAIIERLDAQSAKIDKLQSEIDQMKGGLTVLKAIGAFLGVGGIGALLAWLQSQGK
jgi:tetrahydromethanopterin S-methyltransferase subunit G